MGLSEVSPAQAADGPVACVPGLTLPPYPDAGFCADYDGYTTWYGTYGPGFPTAQGSGLCGAPPASGGDFPSPSYDYVAGAPPTGAQGDWNALGFAFSEGEAGGFWNGATGRFTSDQAAAAAKLLYDTVAWGTPTPSMDPGVLAAYDTIDGWYTQARGISAGAPIMTVQLTSGQSSFTGSAEEQIHLQYPGTNAPLTGQGITLAILNGTFDSAGGPTTVTASTDAQGNVDVALFATSSEPDTVTVAVAAEVGQSGLDFYHPTTGQLSAQVLVGYVPPTRLAQFQSLTSNGTPAPPTGTISVQKSVNDGAYYGPAAAVFQVVQDGTVVATLTTNAQGATAKSGALPVGTYTVHEATPPPGYDVAPDQTVAVTADENTVALFTGTNGDQVVPGTITIHKNDAQTGSPLGGAVFDVRYSSANNGSFDQDLGQCTTGPTGVCTPVGNDGGGVLFLPGDYSVQEITAPPGYYLNPTTALQTLALTPGQAGSVTFSDFELGSLAIAKAGDDQAYAPVTGAVFSASGPLPSTGIVGQLTVGDNGLSNTITGLIPGSYVLTETAPPAGYAAVAPLTVAVPDGDTVTTVNVLDHVVPASLAIVKVDAASHTPLAGATFSVAYDAGGTGVYSENLGSCTTNVSGDCTPVGNDGPSALLPGNYRITETQAPPGYLLVANSSTQFVTLTPGETATVTFSDPLLVAAAFEKVANGAYNPAIGTLAGAAIAVHQGDLSGPVVATCTTDAAGACTTGTDMSSGSPYCWDETVAPPGLASGAHGCFTADNGQAFQPITVTDAGMFVAVMVKKVDAADPSVGLPGAVFDLYRVDGGQGPGAAPVPPQGATNVPGETWMARANSGPDGSADFPLQFPGFAYCAVETQAPDNYVRNDSPQCTGVVTGSGGPTAASVTLTEPNTPQTVSIVAHKFNSLVPDTGIPGAVYDLYAQGDGPPNQNAASPPSDAATETGNTWFARGTSDASGNLSFTVPAGYAWCLLEHAAPPDYLADPGLHCTQVITSSTPQTASIVALPETPGVLYIAAHKFNLLQPDTVIPGASYELVAQGPMPAGYAAASAPTDAPVPSGDTYWGQGTTDAGGLLSFKVPAGYAWCLHELSAPPRYEPDPAFHCTTVLTTQTLAVAATVALPEVPTPWPLAFTGGPGWWVPGGGILLIIGGFGLLEMRRRSERALASAAGAFVDGVDEHPQPGEVPFVEAESQPG